MVRGGPICPKPGCGRPGHRVYAQVSLESTGYATSITLPFVFCGSKGKGPDGRPTLARGPKDHGLVELSPSAFESWKAKARGQRKARLALADRKGTKPKTRDDGEIAARTAARRDHPQAPKKAPRSPRNP